MTSRNRILTLSAFTVLNFILNISGRLLHASPAWLINAITLTAAVLIIHTPNKRARKARSNLHHCFPDKSRGWRDDVLLQSTRGMVETALFVLASPFLDRSQIRRQFSVARETLQLFEESRAEQKPAIVLVPHCRLMEAITFLPVLIEQGFPEVGVIYRPLKNPKLENWVLRTRQRFGLRMLSRRDGFLDAVRILEGGGAVAILFDQNAGTIGSLTTFMDRLCSTTELPGLLAVKGRASVYAAWVEPNGSPFGGIVRGERLPSSRDVLTNTFNANQWLEDKLCNDSDFRANWLWMHDRWRHQDEPDFRFSLHSRRNAIRETLEFQGKPALPRNYRILIRMPNWLGDVLMSLPLIKALRTSRPDAEITLLAAGPLTGFLTASGVADKIIALPPRGIGYLPRIYKLRQMYFDTHLILTHSTRSDIEGLLIGTPQRFGRVIPGRRRIGLTHPWRQPDDLDESRMHQTTLWAKMLTGYGLKLPPDCSPLHIPHTARPPSLPDGTRVGLICGTENTPEKRWPVKHWRELLTALLSEFPETHFLLFGTGRDKPITGAVCSEFPVDRVHDFAGGTTLMEFASALTACKCIICNDTGGMHLANALGIPVIALYGPTNPIRTGPVFEAPRVILQPPGSPPTGGKPIDGILPEAVLAAYRELPGSR